MSWHLLVPWAAPAGLGYLAVLLAGLYFGLRQEYRGSSESTDN